MICSVGPVIDGNALEVTRDYIKKYVVEYISKDNNDWIHFLEFDHQVESDGYGVSGHPSLKTHELMGKSLANFVSVILMWKN